MPELPLGNAITSAEQTASVWGSGTTPNSHEISGSPEASAKLLIQLLSGEFPDKVAVQNAVGDIVSPGRSATDTEVRDLFARFSETLKPLGPGADEYVQRLIESYDQLPDSASAPLW
jgi:hypothetical protein